MIVTLLVMVLSLPSVAGATELRADELNPAAASLASPAVATSPTPDGAGHVVLHRDGQVTTRGSGLFLGDARTVMNARRTSAASIQSTPGLGYWIVDSTGGVHTFGDAPHHGDLYGLPLASPIVALRPTASLQGYWLVANDGGVFAFGDAKYHGSMGGIPLNAPVVDFAPTPSGNGYWMVATDGGIFAFGDARFYGSMGGVKLVRPVVGISPDPSGRGYLLVAADGGTFAFGSVEFHGSLGGQGVYDIVDGENHPSGVGYVVLRSGGEVVDFPLVRQGPALTERRIAAEIQRRVNAERAYRGLAPLAWDPLLGNTASSWAPELVGSFEHSNLSATLNSLGGAITYMGENIYWGSGSSGDAASAHIALMQSTPHRSSLLSPTYTDMGVGIHCSGGALYVVQHFGRDAAAGPGSASPTAPAAPLTQSGADSVGC
ncbi:MAG: CAP domain-containing protein [Actinomycetota bacterium]